MLRSSVAAAEQLGTTVSGVNDLVTGPLVEAAVDDVRVTRA